MIHYVFLIRVGNIDPLGTGRTIKVYAVDSCDAWNKASVFVKSYEFIQSISKE